MSNMANHASTSGYLSKWFGLSCATFLMLQAGLQYAFSVYGSPLAEQLGLTTGQFELLGAVANAGGYLAMPSGIFFSLCASHPIDSFVHTPAHRFLAEKLGGHLLHAMPRSTSSR